MRRRKTTDSNNALPAKYLQDDLASTPEACISRLEEIFGRTSDLLTRKFPGGQVLFLRTQVDQRRLEETVLRQIGQGFRLELISSANLTVIDTYAAAAQELLSGSALLFCEHGLGFYAVRLTSADHRAIEEPSTESVIRGPRSGFTEEIDLNLCLVRKRLKSTSLRVEERVLGTVTKTRVMLLYEEGLVEPSLLEEIRLRLDGIVLDGVLESNYVEEMIQDSPYSLFPTIQNTERPDVVVASLLEGRIALIVDGSPFALIAPLSFWGALQASEDYYSHYTIATAIRWIRFVFLFISLLFPSIYVAITTFHQEMLPTNLLLSVAAAREGSPFPALIEALMMEVTFEALREAGVRLPRPVGQAVSIVGALVIGQAAVEAGIISAPMVIVVSITGIASFTIPRYNFGYAMRLLRFPFIILAGSLGLYGIVIAMMVLVVHLSGLRSLGVPYLAPVSPLSAGGLKDVFVRVPMWMMNRRPKQLSKENRVRVPAGQQPEPPGSGGEGP